MFCTNAIMNGHCLVRRPCAVQFIVTLQCEPIFKMHRHRYLWACVSVRVTRFFLMWLNWNGGIFNYYYFFFRWSKRETFFPGRSHFRSFHHVSLNFTPKSSEQIGRTSHRIFDEPWPLEWRANSGVSVFLLLLLFSVWLIFTFCARKHIKFQFLKKFVKHSNARIQMEISKRLYFPSKD